MKHGDPQKSSALSDSGSIGQKSRYIFKFFFRALKGNDATYKILCPRSVRDNDIEDSR